MNNRAFQLAAVTGAIAMITFGGPKPLLKRVNLQLEEDDDDLLLESSELISLLTEATNPNEPCQIEFRLALSKWDQATGDLWLQNAPPEAELPRKNGRRNYILERLGFETEHFSAINASFPVIEDEVIVWKEQDDRWPWYDEERRQRSHYWDVYRGVLARRGFDKEAIARLDQSTNDIVGRLADPTWDVTYQAKGLVVGHVQSGKTANFTGTIAKAIDAGYRLVIVLTGTLELLRSQTQRRLDKELVGFENIVGGIDLSDEQLARENIDYISNRDADWEAGDRFVRFGFDPANEAEVPHVVRLTKSDHDYNSLKTGLSTLDYRGDIRNPSRKIYDPSNLWDAPVRLVVMKKNAAVLRKLIKDLKQIRGNTQDYPAIIIDDEADQAGINTKKPPVKLTNEEVAEEERDRKERTTINRLLSDLLALLPRAQYVGYTATPFANVFIDPSDIDDIFPKDFLLSLIPPAAYMGGKSFHDHDKVFDPHEKRTATNSNQAAYVRNISSSPDDLSCRELEMQAALDSFVLSGAIKLWRKAKGTPGDFTHHTMLFHESVRQAEHAELAREIDCLWKGSDYQGFSGFDRLQRLWTTDYSPVMEGLASRTDGELPLAFQHPIPASFEDAAVYFGDVVKLVESGVSPVAVVNGDKESEYAQADVDFQRDPVWKILVGGAKLSRGYTVEGLTVTWYSRKALAADTLMQMGRWFGYRPGYRDLVRLYIGRNVPATAKSSRKYDLYEAFERMIEDEEDFRDQLAQFAAVDEDGIPQVRPIDIPPLVSQSLPWLRPTARNRMYNASIVQYAKGERFKDFFALPNRDPDVCKNADNLKVAANLLRKLEDRETVAFETTAGNSSSYEALTAVVAATEVVDVLKGLAWAVPGFADPDIAFVEQAIEQGKITDFKVVMQVPSDSVQCEIDIAALEGILFPIIQRKRRDRGGFSGSSPGTRRPLEESYTLAKPVTSRESRTTGAVIIALAADQMTESDPSALLPGPVTADDIATLLSWALPHDAAPKGKAGFSVIVPNNDAATVPIKLT
ncbi:Z1 domain-containing protein [Arthrobacter rhombi]|uniref:Z1 domain-containing protein n=1 Tax=Arthrobacter rhombi TaxID=71253 RepID=UPI003FD1AC47